MDAEYYIGAIAYLHVALATVGGLGWVWILFLWEPSEVKRSHIPLVARKTLLIIACLCSSLLFIYFGMKVDKFPSGVLYVINTDSFLAETFGPNYGKLALLSVLSSIAPILIGLEKLNKSEKMISERENDPYEIFNRTEIFYYQGEDGSYKSPFFAGDTGEEDLRRWGVENDIRGNQFLVECTGMDIHGKSNPFTPTEE